MESSACTCGPKSAFRSNFGPFEPQNMTKIPIFFLLKCGYASKNSYRIFKTDYQWMFQPVLVAVEPEDSCEAQTLQLY